MRLHKSRKSSTVVCIGCGRKQRITVPLDLPCIKCTRGTVYVYAIECGKFLKIGSTQDIHARIGNYRSYSPYETKLLFAQIITNSKAGVAAEMDLLAALRWHHVTGEWHNLNRDSFMVIQKYFRNESMKTAGKSLTKLWRLMK